MTSDPQPPDRGSMARGFLTATLLSVCCFTAAAALSLGEYVVFACGLTQLIWLVPLWIVYRRKRETESAKGVVVAASITFLLNSACWGLLGLVRKYGISG
jgi:hypothetical protein